MTFEKTAKLLLSNSFRFAKTMPKNPHWYTLRDTWENEQDFIDVVLYIREVGYTGYYFKSQYKYFNLNGFKYWTMGAPINYQNGKPCTILINKAVVSYMSDYDKIAFQYIKMFEDEESKSENKRLFDMLDIKGSVLDIGCGDGLLLDYVKPESYTGIDPSSKMLFCLKRKHRDYSNNVINCKFEDFYSDKQFDTIVALFGSASYVKPAYWNRLQSMLSVGGKAYLMFFGDNYFPITHKKTGINPAYYNNEFTGAQFGNFKIVTITKDENLSKTERLRVSDKQDKLFV